jgi:hypothetical protein
VNDDPFELAFPSEIRFDKHHTHTTSINIIIITIIIDNTINNRLFRTGSSRNAISTANRTTERETAISACE